MRILITGGAGFIGSNLAQRLLTRGHTITIYDNLSRPGSAHNLSWLRQVAATLENPFVLIEGELQDAERLMLTARDTDAIIHLAGQVAVTHSVRNPRDDFMSNALGTFNVLEAARLAPTNPIVIYASTNKVYGGMEHLAVTEEPTRYTYRDLPMGIDESQPLDFHSPYGCSKGVGDQYTRDYHRIYGLRTVVFRQSCCYGPRQFGVEDQGWVAHFVIAAQMGRKITIYGDGKQVRDLLYIDDLLDAYELALERIDIAAGQIYNIGGGAAHALSIWVEFEPLLSRLAGHRIVPNQYGDWRPGDQPVFISDIGKAGRELGWLPKVDPVTGIERLWSWVHAHRSLFEGH
ncbi:MAG: NAD-dependent epimerase/dehydratase family protein [Chloroflexaceae bacterium]|nr:NAD-dependent epimerase/dehydratase family protein [Chloroflexaceae bacterium]